MISLLDGDIHLQEPMKQPFAFLWDIQSYQQWVTLLKEPRAYFPEGFSHRLSHKLTHPGLWVVVTHTFLQDVESAPAGNVHSGSPLLLPCSCHPSVPMKNKEGSAGTATSCPGWWQRDLLKAKVQQRKMFVEPQLQALLSGVN